MRKRRHSTILSLLLLAAAEGGSPSPVMAAGLCGGSLEEHKTWLKQIRKDSEAGELRVVINETRNIGGSARACEYPLAQLGTTEEELKKLVTVAARGKVEKGFREIQALPPGTEPDRRVEFYWELAQEYGVATPELRAQAEPLLRRYKEAERAKDQKFSDQIRGSCQARDQRAKLPPVRDQEKMGWCYAYAAADLASFHTGVPLSAVDVALLYNRKVHATREKTKNLGAAIHWATSKEGGGIAFALQNATERGFCRESELPSSDINLATPGGGLAGSLRTLDEMGASPADFARHEELSCLVYQNLVEQWFTNLTFLEFRKIAQEIDQRTLTERLAEQACRKRVAWNAPFKFTDIVWPFDREMREKAMAVFQETLNANHIAGVDVRINGWLLEEFKIKDGPDYHAMTVIGQGRNPKSGDCEFIVRNSWGRSCKYYDPAKVSCDSEGYVYVPQGRFLDQVAGMTLERSPYER